MARSLYETGDRAQMTVQDENGIYRSLARERRNQRRKQLGVALAGLAALGGAGVFVVQSQLIDLSHNTAIREPRAVVPTPTSPSPAPAAAPSGRTVAAASPGRVSRSGARLRMSPPPPPPSPSASPSPSLSPDLAAAAQVNQHSETTGS